MRKTFWYCIFILAAGLLLSLGALWMLASMQTLAFSRPHKIQPGSNPNHYYFVKLQSVHLGAIRQDFVIRVETQLKNSGAVPVNLDARTIKLVDAKGNQYDSAFPPDAETLLLLTPQKATVLWFSFVVPAGALDGELSLLFGQRRHVRIKSPGPLQTKLREGEFYVFRKLTW